jgi:hypothetical protein
MRAAVLMLGVPELRDRLWQLDQIVVMGQGLCAAEHGSPYAWFAENPEQGQLFHQYMAARSQQVAPAVAAGSWCGAGMLVDVGGGGGAFLAEVLSQHRQWRGVLLELPEVLAHAKENFTTRGVLDRVELVEGDFFTTVPPGGTAYLLASILHNFGNDAARRILRNVRAAMGEGGGRVICVDMLLPKGDGPHPSLTLDLRMLTRTARGHERTCQEYTVLLQEGLGVTTRPQITSLPLGLSMLTVDVPPTAAGAS